MFVSGTDKMQSVELNLQTYYTSLNCEWSINQSGHFLHIPGKVNYLEHYLTTVKHRWACLIFFFFSLRVAVTQTTKFTELCVETPCWCLLEGYKHWWLLNNCQKHLSLSFAIKLYYLRASTHRNLYMYFIQWNDRSVSKILKTSCLFIYTTAFSGCHLTSRNANAWKFKSALLQNNEPCWDKTL